MAGDISLSKSEILALEAICGNEGLIMNELAKSLKITLSAVTGIMDRLVDKKLATRKRSQGDRRVVKVFLTADGKKVSAGLRKQREEFFGRMLNLLTESEQEIFVLVLEKIAREIEKKKLRR
ncbi:MAG: MarR family transcriptional regulator [Candidatus Lindowbacteria bacterium]|nr:MarR family transcriptional regulator [Candidatus Lindowbacteria bacterium]